MNMIDYHFNLNYGKNSNRILKRRLKDFKVYSLPFPISFPPKMTVEKFRRNARIKKVRRK